MARQNKCVVVTADMTRKNLSAKSSIVTDRIDCNLGYTYSNLRMDAYLMQNSLDSFEYPRDSSCIWA